MQSRRGAKDREPLKKMNRFPPRRGDSAHLRRPRYACGRGMLAPVRLQRCSKLATRMWRLCNAAGARRTSVSYAVHRCHTVVTWVACTAAPMHFADKAYQQLFRHLFVYNMLFEDTEVDERFLGVGPESRILGISGAGCGIANHLSRRPRRIDAVDINARHLAITALKTASARDLTSYDEFYTLWGHGFARSTRGARVSIDEDASGVDSPALASEPPDIQAFLSPAGSHRAALWRHAQAHARRCELAAPADCCAVVGAAANGGGDLRAHLAQELGGRSAALPASPPRDWRQRGAARSHAARRRHG